MKRLTANAIILIAVCVAAPVGAETANPPPHLDPSIPTEQRAADLVSRLTLEEKAAQMVNSTPSIPRLKVAAYPWLNEALHGGGVHSPESKTIFPEPIGLAATFNAPLIEEMATAIGKEIRILFEIGRAKGRTPETVGGWPSLGAGLDVWAPNINIFRDPRWGRGQETYGEDPYLTARMGVAYVRGLQGPDPERPRVIASPKHFAVHSGPELGRASSNSIVSAYDLEDTYLPAFRAAITEGKAGSVMCAYNAINGQPACGTGVLLKDYLRGPWGFKGYVVGDCGAVSQIESGHKLARSPEEAVALGVKAGVDNECTVYQREDMRSPAEKSRYLNAIKLGLLSEADLDQSLRRTFAARIRLGLFDPPEMRAQTAVNPALLYGPTHRALAQRTAEQSLVLLKNNGALPLVKPMSRLLVTGPLADAEDALLGNYTSMAPHYVSVLDGLKAAMPNAVISHVPGAFFIGKTNSIPRSALRTPDGKPGLKAEYFRITDGQFDSYGQPVKPFDAATYMPISTEAKPFETHIDSVISQNASPSPGAFPDDQRIYAIRWTGFIVPPVTGMYRVGLRGESVRLMIDGKPVVAIGRKASEIGVYAPMNLVKGKRYAVQIDGRHFRQRFVGFKWARYSADPEGELRQQAKKADAIVAVVGITSDVEGEEMHGVEVPGFASGDRTSLDLPADQEALLKVAKATGKPLIVVLLNGGGLAANWAAENADTILEAWYPGPEGGLAVGRALSGAVNPGGRLPITIYKGIDQLPPYESYAMAGRTYRYFKGEPLYPFGYGLSYTRFAYSDLQIATPLLKAGEPLVASVKVTNTGAVAGDEVVQLYLSAQDRDLAPVRALAAFRRITLQPGISEQVKFTVDDRGMSLVRPDGSRGILRGRYAVSIGGGQPSSSVASVAGNFAITGEVSIAK